LFVCFRGGFLVSGLVWWFLERAPKGRKQDVVSKAVAGEEGLLLHFFCGL